MSLFALLDVLCGFPVAAYWQYAFLSRYAGTANLCEALRLRQSFDGTSDQDKNFSFLNWALNLFYFSLWMDTILNVCVDL